MREETITMARAGTPQALSPQRVVRRARALSKLDPRFAAAVKAVAVSDFGDNEKVEALYQLVEQYTPAPRH